ncbi:MAG: polysaccharide deacetylase family protein [Flavobacteriales bacterium]
MRTNDRTFSLIIYNPNNTSRFTYTCEVLFKHILQTDYVLTQVLPQGDDYFISYTEQPTNGAIWVKPSNLLEETTINDTVPKVLKADNRHFLFPNETPLGFDVFSAVFWMVSRYEEYQQTPFDIHGRYSVYNSLAYKEGFLSYPVVHFWARIFAEHIQQTFLHFSFRLPPFKQIITIDVDHAFAFKGKPFSRQTAAVFRDLFAFKWSWLVKRVQCVFGKLDPFYTYDYIHQTASQSAAEEIYFLLAGNYAKYDKNVPDKADCMKQLGQELSAFAPVGVHPSYASHLNAGKVVLEINRVEKLTEKPVTISRQHFLRFSFPQTPLTLVEAGIKQDFSLGYSEESGFRAGMAIPFPFYNLAAEQQTELLLTPFAYMDGTLNEHKKLSTQKAMEQITLLKNEVREFGGNFIAIWHNHSLSETHHWQGWRKVFEHSLKA